MTASKPRIVFVHPQGYNCNPEEKNITRLVNIMVPMGICNLSAWLAKRGYKTEIYDCYAYPDEDKILFRDLREDPPEYLCFSTTTSSFPDGIRIARKAKEIAPKVKTVFGGVHISSLRERLLDEYPVIDYGVVGEGEEALRQLIESGGDGLPGIQGLLYREGSETRFTGFRHELVDMDALPFPAYEKLKGFPRHYQLPMFNYPKAPSTTITTSRGCPFHCSYCDRSVFRSSYRYNSAEYMIDLLAHLNTTYRIRHVNIYDDTFILNKQRIVDFCELKMKSNLKMTFNCAGRVEQIDAGLLALLKKAGCWMISIGVETGDPGLLSKHRHITKKSQADGGLDDIARKICLIKKAGIRVKGLFMMGLPGETEETIDRTMEYVFSLPFDDINVSRFTPFPGSPLYQNIREYGSFNEDWELMNALNFVFIPNGISKARLEEKYHEFYRRHYQRFSVLFEYFTMLWKSFDSWKRFLANLPELLSFTRDYKKK